MQKSYHGLATGVGSFPYQEPAQALEVIFSRVPELPHWPQLPQKTATENMVKQYLAPLVMEGIIREGEDGTPFFAVETSVGEEYLKKLAAINPARDEDLRAYAFPEETAAGFYAFARALNERTLRKARFLKGQLTGPLTMGLMLKDLDGKPSFYNKVLREILTRVLVLQLRWQVRFFRPYKVPFMLFIDEPGLYTVGKKEYGGLSRQAVRDSIGCLIAAAHEEGAEVGVHTCAGTDWSMLFSLPLDIVNIDLYHYFPTLLPFADEIDSFLARGGTLAWGLVPTSQEVREHTAESLGTFMRQVREKLGAAGVDSGRLQSQCLFTPSCGAGTLSDEEVRKVYLLLQEISGKMRAGEY